MTPQAFRLSPPQDPADDDGDGTFTPAGEFPADGDELPYFVEIWDEVGAVVDQVVAVSASPSIGYAAFYAATREFPGRAITLRHRSRVISRWAAQTH